MGLFIARGSYRVRCLYVSKRPIRCARTKEGDMKLWLTLTLSIAILGSTACKREPRVIIVETSPTPLPESRTKTLETRVLGKEIEAFEANPSVTQSARVQKAFADLDGEIAELVAHVEQKTGEERREAERKLADLHEYRNAQNVRFLRAQSTARLEEKREAVIPPASEAAERAERGAEKLGGKIDDAARKVEEGLKDAADAVREKAR
jgi:hypothetical protein